MRVLRGREGRPAGRGPAPWRARRFVVAAGSVLVGGLAVVAGGLGVGGALPAWAHTGLASSDPGPGAVVDVAPTAVRLTFGEEPEPALAVIRVRGEEGTSYATGPPVAVPGDALSLAVPVELPERRVYTVTWRVVSAGDGHPTGGEFSFGVGVPVLGGAGRGVSSKAADLSPAELLGRWLFALGLIAVVGGATARLAGFAGSTAGSTAVAAPAQRTLAEAGLGAATVGLVVLGAAQRAAAEAPWGDLLSTSIGRALIWRSVALGAVAAGLLLGQSRRPGRARRAAWVTVAAGCAAIAVHVAAGHAGSRTSFRTASVVAQWAHVVAVCVWAGGLAALLLAVRGAPPTDQARWVRRYSRVAAPVLGVVVVTGVLRAWGGVSSWGALTSTGYGRGVVAKVVLFGAIVVMAWVNRRRVVPAPAAGLRLLGRLAGGELVLAAAAVAVAALLAGLPPPATRPDVAPPALTATGSDSALTVRVRLTTATAVPGPNRFTVRVTDLGPDRVAAAADRVSLRFTPLDDPSESPTVLALEPTGSETFGGTGSNLAFDGRWGITVVVERGADSVSVPLVVQTTGPPQFLSVQRLPGEPVKYTVELVVGGSFLRVWADPERPGPAQVFATFFDTFGEILPVGDPVLTTGTGSSARQGAVRRLGPGQFVADVTLDPGLTVVAVVARADPGPVRLRGTVTVEAPRP